MKINLQADKDCSKCKGHGIITLVEHNSTFYSFGVKLKACECVIAKISGTVSKKVLSGVTSEMDKLVKGE